MQTSRMIIAGGVAAAIAIAVVMTALRPAPEEAEEPATNFPITVDFARVLPYENVTDRSLGYVMNIRLLYPEEGPPRPFYLLLLKQGESWDDLTTPEKWVKEKRHGFEVLSSSKEFDMFTEFYPFDSTLLPYEMRLHCESCDEDLSDPERVWHGADTKIKKIRGLGVIEGDVLYQVGFSLGNSQIDMLPARGTVEFKLTDSLGVTLYETVFRVEKTDFRSANVEIKLKRIPLGGTAFYEFSIPTEEIQPSPTGRGTGFAFLNFTLDDDGRMFPAGIGDVKLPQR